MHGTRERNHDDQRRQRPYLHPEQQDAERNAHRERRDEVQVNPLAGCHAVSIGHRGGTLKSLGRPLVPNAPGWLVRMRDGTDDPWPGQNGSLVIYASDDRGFLKVLARVRFLTDPAARSEVRATWRETAERATMRRATLLREETELAQAQQAAAQAYVRAPERTREVLDLEIESRAVRLRKVRRQLGEVAGEVHREAEQTLDLIEAVLRATDGLVSDGRKIHTPVTSPLFGLIPQHLAIQSELVATESRVAPPICVSWNQLERWLQATDGLRQRA